MRSAAIGCAGFDNVLLLFIKGKNPPIWLHLRVLCVCCIIWNFPILARGSFGYN
jgi:hypothetical protein